MTYDVSGPEAPISAFAFRSALDQLARDAVDAVRGGVVILVLSDRDVDRDRAPLPALLVDQRGGPGARSRGPRHARGPGDRHRRSARCASGGGAAGLRRVRALPVAGVYDRANASPPRRALVRAKPWRSTATRCSRACSRRCRRWASARVAAYQGSHLMEIVGLHRSFVDDCFSDTPAITGAVTLEEIAIESVRWHRDAASRDQRFAAASRLPRLPSRRRLPLVEPGDGEAVPSGGRPAAAGRLREVRGARARPAGGDDSRSAGFRAAIGSDRRSTRSSRSSGSGRGSLPRRCRSARWVRKRTARSPKR